MPQGSLLIALALVLDACTGPAAPTASATATTAAPPAPTATAATSAPTTVPATAPVATAEPPPVPVNVLISVESPRCPSGGPIYSWTDGRLSVLARSGTLKKPRDGTLDGQGNLVIADAQAGLLRVSLSTGAVSLIAGGPPYQPRDVVIEPSGNYVVIDWPEGIHPEVGPALYRITPTGQVSVIARGAPMAGPHGLDRDAQGNFIVSDGTGLIIRISPQGQQTVVVARGPSGFRAGADVVVDRDGTYVVADTAGALWRVTPSGQIRAIHVGDPFSVATGTIDPRTDILPGPRSVAITPAGNYVVADSRTSTIFHVTPAGAVYPMLRDATLCDAAGVIVLR